MMFRSVLTVGLPDELRCQLSLSLSKISIGTHKTGTIFISSGRSTYSTEPGYSGARILDYAERGGGGGGGGSMHASQQTKSNQ